MSFLAEQLKKDKFFSKLLIFGVDKKKIKKNKFFKKIFKLNVKNKKKFIQKLFKICVNNKIELIIPFSDEEAECLSDNIKIFTKKNIKIMVNDFKCIKLILEVFL